MNSLGVCYEDANMVVLDKPAGLHTAPLRPGDTDTLLAMAIARYPEVAGLPGMKPVEPGLVHRLDRDTSGCVVIARTARAFDVLRDAFTTGSASKEYIAACACTEAAPEGAPSDGRLHIESRFAPYGEGRRRVRVVLPGGTPRRARRAATPDLYATDARVIARSGDRALLTVSIRRGFRHQVRAHLAALGFPILGDLLYGAPVPPGYAARMYLHAARIELPHPDTGARIVVESPLPEEFKALFPGRPA
jgi:23S rRNA pseudouridine1911/1915/1917 synthase